MGYVASKWHVACVEVLIAKLVMSKGLNMVQARAKVDNTVRENKNNACLLYLAWLVASCGFRVAGFLNARVGHTHNRLGFWMIQIATFPRNCELFIHFVRIDSRYWMTLQETETPSMGSWPHLCGT